MVSMLIHALLIWPENISMLSMLPHAFAKHGNARKAWGAWENDGLPMNPMLFSMLPIPGGKCSNLNIYLFSSVFLVG